jgi:2-polyprenyl-3-methyl-5-hydroxy-6-metoxy-1,4-benzoquinol methylase
LFKFKFNILFFASLMANCITYPNCPACGSSSIQRVLVAKDYTVSGKEFEIWECGKCTLRFTQHVPPAEEIGPYYQSESYISHTDTRKGLVNRLYHVVRGITLKSKQRLIEKVTGKKSGQLLDVGAGTGAFLHHMRKQGWLVEGLEPDHSARTRAEQQYQLVLLPSDYLFKLEPASKDVITLWHVLEHVHRLQDYMEQLKKLLKPGGRLIIAVPNYTSGDAQQYGATWAAYDVPRHLYHFSPKAMKQLIQQHGLQLKAIRPMWFDSYYVSMLSEKYKTGKQSLVKGALAGAVSNGKALFNRERCSSLIYIITTAV